MAKFLLDTTTLINHLRGCRGVVEQITTLARQGHRLGLCCINVAEVYSGLSQEERAKADRLINSLDFYDITREVARQAGRYRYDFARQGITLSTADTLIAAVAVAESATLITANVRHFPIEEIQLLVHP